MKELIIEVENLKCGGCETTLHNALIKLNGIHDVKIDIDNSMVSLEYVGNKEAKEKTIEKKLAQIGYPKRGTGNNFQKAKSYVSCAIGKISDTKSSQ
jgi:copper chaperone CopZ